MKRTARILAVIAFALCGFQSSNLNAKDKNIGVATADDAATNLKMLQGKWQAVDDKSDFLVFENNHRREKGGGDPKWDDEVFVLTDKPMRDGKEQDTLVKEKAHFIYCEKSDLCWGIAELTAKKLVLVFKSGRGSMLEYRRVN